MSRVTRILMCLAVAAVFLLVSSESAEAQQARFGWSRDGYWPSYWQWYDGYLRPYYFRRSFRPPSSRYGYGSGWYGYGSPWFSYGSPRYQRPYEYTPLDADFGLRSRWY